MAYNKYYQTENYFGAPYPELLQFFEKIPAKGKVLDLGCGQGRDAIPIARLGFEVIGVDNSEVGIEQMNQIAEKEKLKLKGIVSDLYKMEGFGDFDFILLDSMFHFAKKDKKKEVKLIRRILENAKIGCLIIFCIQNVTKKVEVLNHTIDQIKNLERVTETNLIYEFIDKASNHSSETEYKMTVIKK